MLVFLDFEASSLAKKSYPIEVAWVFEDGSSEEYLIKPLPEWTDWDPEAEAIHHISRDMLMRDGQAPETVANRMVEVLFGHDLLASAPSWDGKWLSVLLRAAGLPRRTLTLRDSDAAVRDVAATSLASAYPSCDLDRSVEQLVADVEEGQAITPPAHRALADANAERALWLAVRDTAKARMTHRHGGS